MEGFFDTLKREDQIILELRDLFSRWGYRQFKMSRFEEYDFYVQNKNFLTCENIITFTDMDGKLLALKPDITLSIAKHSQAKKVSSDRLYYLENVYRLSKENDEFQEIHQMGLEFLGQVDLYSTIEVVRLALSSLATISDNFILEVSHMAFISGLLDGLEIEEEGKGQLLSYIASKNPHGLETLAKDLGLRGEDRKRLGQLIFLYGDYEKTLGAAQDLVINDSMQKALQELAALYDALSGMRLAKNLQLDFSMAQDLDYYSGIILQGYIQGIPHALLSGGRYDNLMRKFHKDTGALGFALYLNELERYFKASSSYHVEALVLYDDKADLGRLSTKAQGLINEGITLRVDRQIPPGLRYKRLYQFKGDSLVEVDRDVEHSST